MKKYLTYKPSGYSWFGDIPSDWDIKDLKHELKFQTGGTPSTKESKYYEGDNTWVTIGDMTGRLVSESSQLITKEGIESANIQITPKGSLLYSFKLSVGQVAFAGKDLYTNEAIASFLPSIKYDISYWYYALPFILIHNANENIYGAKLLNQELIKNAAMIVPSKNEQQTIVRFLDFKLDQIDRFIVNRKKQIELLREQKFGIIDKAVTKGINSKTKMKKSKIEWIDEIPETWEVWKLKFLTKIISKGTTPSTEGKDLLEVGAIRFLKAENITPDGITYDPKFFIDEETNQILKRSKLQHNDILFVIAGATIGKAAILDKKFLPANTNQAVCFIRLRNRIMPELVYHQLQSNYIKNKMKIESVVAAQPNISMEDIGNFQIFLPPLGEQENLLRYIQKEANIIEMLISKYQNQIDLMEEHRSSLISQSVTGKIDVREWRPLGKADM